MDDSAGTGGGISAGVAGGVDDDGGAASTIQSGTGTNTASAFLVKHKLMNPSQHGFLKARSCLTNLLCFLGNN